MAAAASEQSPRGARVAAVQRSLHVCRVLSPPSDGCRSRGPPHGGEVSVCCPVAGPGSLLLSPWSLCTHQLRGSVVQTLLAVVCPLHKARRASHSSGRNKGRCYGGC